ncbi:MAG: DUF4838 domain-containing protein [Candidatus Omnitrophica bacterium]|nr:DUF4838 domain-containing protein [Candidatus Omnitrophota bacterium]
MQKASRIIIVLILMITGCAGNAASFSGPLAAPKKSRPVAAGEKPVVIVSQGQAKAVIVIPDGAEDWAQKLYAQAAEELREYVAQATGAKLVIVASAKYDGGPAVFVGLSEAAQKAGFDPGELRAEGFRVVTKSGNLAILGSDDSPSRYGSIAGYNQKEVDTTGTLFGVYDVLERFVGVRWYWPGELGTIVPRSPDLKISPVDYTDAPMLGRRDMWPFQYYPDSPSDQALFQKKWRHGNGTGVVWNHSYVGWDELYGKTHPEYFALLKDGTRDTTYYHGHFCYSCPGVLAQEMANFAAFYEKGDASPWAGWSIAPRADYVQMLPNDCYGGCECADCQKMIQLRKAKIPELEEHSELIHNYYAKVAAEVKKRWPEKKVIVGAYDTYTLPPRTVTYPDNVVVGLCIMDGMAFHRDPKIRKFWFGVIDEYNRLTKNPVEVWNYICWPQTSTKAPLHFPFTVVDWHREISGRVSGEFINGGTGRSYALDHLTMYFWYKAMWNPNFNVQSALNEYYKLCYGPAAPAMKKYYDLMINRWEKVLWDVPAGRVGGLPLDQLYGETYPKKIRDRLKALEVKAAAAAPAGSDFRRRVDYVVAAHQPFYAEADAFAKLGDGNKLTLPRGTPVAVDGKLDDPCWEKNKGVMMVDKSSVALAPVDSQVRGCWDEDALYFALRFSEPEMAKLVAEKDGTTGVWMNDCVEIFISPGVPDHYLQIVIDAGGNVFDGWKPATAVYTDVKNFRIEKAISRASDYWTIEVKIPFSEIGVKAPAPGTAWRGNLIRVHRAGREAYQAEFYYLSSAMGQSHHNPRFFGTFILDGAEGK